MEVSASARAHVVLPEDLIEKVDRIAGKRKRSHFVEEAIREKLARERLATAMRESAGSINLADYPEWSTPEKVSEWVRSRRREDDLRLSEKLAGGGE
jgi:metal-responsive CopG/Arc/MetJ family transcriptional regulator